MDTERQVLEAQLVAAPGTDVVMDVTHFKVKKQNKTTSITGQNLLDENSAQPKRPYCYRCCI